jgi:hypothetical protein
MNNMNSTQVTRFNWKPSAYAAGCSVLSACLVELLPAFDLFELLYFFIVVPLIGLILLVIAIFKRKFSIWPMFAMFCLLSFIFWKKAYDIRTVERWALWSKGYKATVLAQPSTPNGYLKHAEWDGWGWACFDTTVYLVFHPNDSLAAAAKSHSSGKFNGIPCAVYRVRRLEDHWYSVVFYTDLDWDHCSA